MGCPAGALISYQRTATIHGRLGDRNGQATALDATGTAYREMDHAEQAIDFHRQAAELLRAPGHRWRLTVVLDNLATALDLTGDTNAALACWREAKPLIEDFHDPQATELRQRVSNHLGSRGVQQCGATSAEPGRD